MKPKRVNIVNLEKILMWNSKEAKRVRSEKKLGEFQLDYDNMGLRNGLYTYIYNKIRFCNCLYIYIYIYIYLYL